MPLLGDERVVDPDDRRLYVADDGPGIPPDRRDDVLERGYTTGEDGADD